MKEFLKDLVRQSASPIQRRNLVREYLQARILGALQGKGAFIPLAFQGGTALRFLYGLPRHSEDLDFSLERPRRGYDLQAYAAAASSALSKEGYAIDVKLSLEGAVQSCALRFRGLFFELGLSAHEDEALSIKLEVDTKPPAGAGLEISVVRKYALLRLQHHDRASLLAGKLHAILQRKYTKGRDLYDLLWYLSDRAWPSPNLRLLKNALRQTGWSGPGLTSDNWKAILAERLEQVDWRAAQADVLPFLERPEEADLLEKEALLGLLK
jgi:hypothetical protein